MHLPKIVAIGIYDSKMIRPNISISKNRKVTMFEIELPMEDGGICYIDSFSKKINTNMVICAKPGQIRHTKFPFKCFYIHIVVQPGVIHDILMKAPDCFEIEKAEKYRYIFSEMIRYSNSFSETEEIMIQSKLLELIYMIKNSSVNPIKIKGSTNNALIIERTLNYIDMHLTENLSLESIAKLNSLSTIHFHNIFKTATGKTLRKYIEEQRIRKAITFLLTTNYNLTRIAYECGFSSQSYFSYAFKRKMDCTPREYIKKIYIKYEI